MSRTDKMEKFLDELGPIVDGDRAAIERHADFLADDDAARDLRHEAGVVAESLEGAGDDWVMPDDLEAKILASIDAKAASFGTERTTQPGFAATPATSSDAEARAASSHAEAPTTSSDAEAPLPLPHAGEGRGEGTTTSSSTLTTPTTADRDHAIASTVGMPAPVVSLADARAERERAPAAQTEAPKTGRRGMGRVIVLFSALAAMGVAAAAAFTFWPSGGTTTTDPSVVASTGGLTGTLEQVVRAAAGETGTGVEVMPAGGTFAAIAIGATLPAGATIRTDERTRARLTFSDGSELVLNHSTEVLIDAQHSRHFDLRSGEVVADVAHLDDGPMAVFTTPSGRVNVVGTSFVLAATPDISSVRVTRGKVRVASAGSSESDVEAGEEGILRTGRAPEVAPTIDLARAVAWASLDEDNGSSTTEVSTVPGVGSLRARRPGEHEDRERPLFVESQHVRVRIAGNVARTEIEQVFQNDSGDQLEGTYRFPLPSDARISRLALEVDGQLQEGAFVARNRASQIWAGVIRHATPVAHRDPHEEYIWVPGPWRDPALLEWQRGGNFELRIFPIPAHGSRRIVIAYTQVIPPTAEGRRYVYPLAHSRDGTLRIGELDVDVRVQGSTAVRASGYHLDQSTRDGAQALHYAARDFLPAGDIVIDYERPEGESELSYYAYTGPAATAPPEHAREHDEDVVAAQRALAADTRGYVAFALHPHLPARTEGRPHDYVIVLDSSQSMVGERFQRASTVALGMIAEMDRRDRFTILACDFECRSMDEGNTPRGFRTPSSSEVADVTAWLSHVEPAGSSDLVATLRRVSHVRDRDTGRDVHVVYVGDGIASVGHRGAGAIATATEGFAESEHVSFTTLGIGQEADSVTLAAIARAGGGHYVPFVPGERASSTALAVLETTYGVSLRDAAVTLPEGLSEMAPAQLPTIRAGEEVVIVARMDRPDVTGSVTLRGSVGGTSFEQTYPVHVVASTAAGNLFVPSLWASGTIERLELDDRGEDEPRIIALSRAYSVMSRHTSLLVLESEAMFRAFGVDRTEQTAQWTGDEDVEGDTAAGEAQVEDELQQQAMLGSIGGGSTRSSHGAGFGGMDDLSEGDALDRTASGPMPDTAARGRGSLGHASPAPSMPTTPRTSAQAVAPPSPEREQRADAATAVTEAPMSATGMRMTGPSRSGQWMHRVWYRVGDVAEEGVPGQREIEAASRAEEELRLAPDSRDRHRAAVRALSRVGRLDRALEITESWISRDRLDPEALAARADVLGRMGQRDEAIRVLSGVVDLRPDDQALQERLASSLERAGDTERACASRVAIAESHLEDAALVGTAVRCERVAGFRSLSDALLAAVREERTRARALDLADELPSAPSTHRDLSVEASWSGAVDLDITIVAPDGTRLSWMGGRTTVVGRDAAAIGHETLGLRTATVGSYVIEIARTHLDDRRPITGELRIRSLDASRTVPFRLDHERVEVARARIRRESRLEPVR
jgi:ferric-dicitrate binding protein FerR (iron transport regulator)